MPNAPAILPSLDYGLHHLETTQSMFSEGASTNQVSSEAGSYQPNPGVHMQHGRSNRMGLTAPASSDLVGPTQDKDAQVMPIDFLHNLGHYPTSVDLEDSYPGTPLPPLIEHPHHPDSILTCHYSSCTLHPKALHITISMANSTTSIIIDPGQSIKSPSPSPNPPNNPIPSSAPRYELTNLLLGLNIDPTRLAVYLQAQERHERIPLGQLALELGLTCNDVELHEISRILDH